MVDGTAWSVSLQEFLKIHKHESNTFAIGITGHMPGPRSLKAIMSTMYTMLLKHHIEDSSESMTLTDEIKDTLFNETRNSIIVMTASDTWLMEKIQKQWVEITHMDYFMGNGAAAAVICIAAGLDVSQSIGELSFVSTECGPERDIVKMKELTLFSVEASND